MMAINLILLLIKANPPALSNSEWDNQDAIQLYPLRISYTRGFIVS